MKALRLQNAKKNKRVEEDNLMFPIEEQVDEDE